MNLILCSETLGKKIKISKHPYFHYVLGHFDQKFPVFSLLQKMNYKKKQMTIREVT